MPTKPTPNFTSLLTSLPRLTRTTTHHLLRACQALKHDWHSLSHTQRFRALRLAVLQSGPRGPQSLREKQKVVARGMAMLQSWMYRGIRIPGRGRRRLAGRQGRRARDGVARRVLGARKGESARAGVPARRAGEAPLRRETREVVMVMVERDAVVPVAMRDAATQTSEGTATTTTSSPTPVSVPIISTTTTAGAALSSASSSSSLSTPPSILHHQLAHLHAEFASLQHAFFALQAGHSSLHNYVLDQQVRNRSLLHELRAENRRLEMANGKRVHGLEGEIEELKRENMRLRGFVERLRDETGKMLLGVGDKGDKGEGEEVGGEDSGFGGEM